MRVITLEIKNFGNIRALTMTPDPSRDMITVTGPNGAGKSNLLAAINFLLPHKATARRKEYDAVLTAGETDGFVRADLGDYILERHFNEDGVKSLKVSRADGKKVTASPGAIVEGLLGEFGLDVGRLVTAAEDRDKLSKIFLQVFGLEERFERLRREAADLYNQRQEIGRRRSALGNPEVVNPVEPVSTAALMRELEEAEEVNRAAGGLEGAAVKAQAELEDWERRVESLEQQLKEAQGRLLSAADAVTVARQAAAAAPRVDTVPIREKLARADEVNAAATIYNQYLKSLEEIDRLEKQYGAKSQELDAKRAEVKALFDGLEYPVPGLSYDPDDGLSYEGHTRISTGNLIKIAFALIAKSRPKLDVVLIPDASLLDAENRAEIAGLAKEHGCQVFLEVVYTGQPVKDGDIYIEAGVAERR